jgi:hypothetical protein
MATQYLLGEAYRRSGDGTRAAETFEPALVLDPLHAGAHYRLRELRASS